jgi:hypothetical protein
MLYTANIYIVGSARMAISALSGKQHQTAAAPRGLLNPDRSSRHRLLGERSSARTGIEIKRLIALPKASCQVVVTQPLATQFSNLNMKIAGEYHH